MRVNRLFGRGSILAFLLFPLTLTSGLRAQSPEHEGVHHPKRWDLPHELIVDTERREVVIEIGPFDMEADTDHHDQPQPLTRSVFLPVDLYLHGFEVELVDRYGQPVPQQILHHINVIAAERRELFSQIMLRVAAAGQETGAVTLPRLVGMKVEEGEEFLVATMLHNPTPSDYEGVVIRVRMPYTPADAMVKPISAYPFYIDVMPPAGETHAYDIPPGRSVKSWEGSPAVPGRVLGVGGHLHKYGVTLLFEDLTTGKVLWEAEPFLDEEGEVIGMPIRRFFWRFGIPLRPDHTYRLTAIYENPTGETIPEGAMGTLGGVFIPKRGTEWPEIDPDDPEYQLDYFVNRVLGAGQVTSSDTGAHSHPRVGSNGDRLHR